MSKSSSGDAASSDWVLESVVQFLRSPLWNVPILTYIEEHSIIFDASIEEHEEYHKKHQQYKDLVGLLISSYIEDMGMSQKQFIEACDMDSSKSTTQYRQGLFEQMWAADDYQVFKRMMTQKNVELELQALHMIRQRNGVIPESMTTPELGDEETLMQEVLRLSKEEYETEQKLKTERVNREMEIAIAQSDSHREMLEAERNVEKELMDKAVKLSISSKYEDEAVPITVNESPTDDKKAPVTVSDTKPTPLTLSSDKKSGSNKKNIEKKKSETITKAKATDDKEVKTGQEAAAQWMADAKSEAQQNLQDKRLTMVSDVSSTELDRRKEYLKRQRDRLIALKKAAREKELASYEAGGGHSQVSNSKQRPKSAKAARSGLVGQTNVTGGGIDEKTLSMRKALASKLRKEVINSEEFH